MQIGHLLRHKGHDVATIEGSRSVRDALALLAERRIGALVISEDGRRIDGILSERDIARGLHERGAGQLGDPSTNVMTAEEHTRGPGEQLTELARLMTDERVRHVPVVDDDVLVGIVSIGDVVKARLDELEEERRQLVDYIQTV